MRGTKQGFRRTIASLLVFSLCIAAVPALPAKADNKDTIVIPFSAETKQGREEIYDLIDQLTGKEEVTQ